MWSIALRFAAIALVLAAAGPARATVVVSGTLDDLVSDSAVVLHGTVRSVDDHGTPFRTVVEVEVTEALKGLPAAARTFRLELPGGRSGDLAMVVPGMPRFALDDEVVLLLEKTPQGGFVPAGLGQGVFRVDRTQPVAQVRRELRSATYVDQQGREAPVPPAPRTLDDLLAKIRTLVAAGAPR